MAGPVALTEEGEFTTQQHGWPQVVKEVETTEVSTLCVLVQEAVTRQSRHITHTASRGTHNKHWLLVYPNTPDIFYSRTTHLRPPPQIGVVLKGGWSLIRGLVILMFLINSYIYAYHNNYYPYSMYDFD